MIDFSTVLTTTDGAELSDLIASELLSRHLAACVQVLDIHSHYRWEGELRKDAEQLLLIKARTADFESIESVITQLHTYDEPEIIQLPITNGSHGYLDWISRETTRANDPAITPRQDRGVAEG